MKSMNIAYKSIMVCFICALFIAPGVLFAKTETLEDIGSYSAALPFAVPNIPIPEVSISPEDITKTLAAEKINVGNVSFLAFDNPLTKLNNEIKQKLGIDIPVFIGAIFKGVLWLIAWVQTAVAKLLTHLPG